MKKEKKKSRIASFLSRVVQVRNWSDWNRIRDGGKSIEDAAKSLFVLKTATSVETFDEAQRRMNLSNDDLIVRCNALLVWSIVSLVVAASLFLYAIYHFVYGVFHAGLLVFALSCVSAALSYRYNFWYFQIKTRKLGCTFDEWYQYTFKGIKP